MRQIVLITDFGTQDQYIGLMKGVITRITKENNIIDLNNNIRPQNILQASFILSKSVKYFSEDSIFCCVVDPGVGTDRKILIVKNKNQCFVAPDNGLLAGVITEESSIFYANSSYIDKIQNSNTFHGRDIFAPLASEMSIGNDSIILGERVSFNNVKTIDINEITIGDKVFGKIMNIDVYGNIVTNINGGNISNFHSIEYRDEVITNNSNNYSDSDGNLFFYNGSCETVEIGIKNKSANKYLKSNIGDDVIAIKKKGYLKVTPLNKYY